MRACMRVRVRVQVHLGLLEGRATHVVWPPWRWGRVSDWAAAEERLIHKEAAAAR